MNNKFSKLAGETLTIVQPSIWKNLYELKHQDEVLMKMKPRSVFGFGLIIELDNKEWEFYRSNFWGSELAFREKGKENPVAVYSKKFFSREGTISLPMGRRLTIKFGLMRSQYGIYASSGECLVILKDKISFKTSSVVSIESSSEILDKYPWIIVLPWYLTRRKKRTAAH
ncbi:MAG TPA: hypothetical protein VI230_04475 [Ignavibacteriaceae bacterium]